MADIELTLGTVPVHFLSGHSSFAAAEGNNAAWICECAESIPLIGRCYFQFGHDCHTVCPACSRTYRVHGDVKKRASAVQEIPPIKP
jgi:hypothetical protein